MNLNKLTWILSVGLLLFVSAFLSFVLADIYYHNPDSTISQGWIEGSDSTHAEVVDSARQPNEPYTDTFVATRSNDDATSEFGFPEVSSDAVNITLWVYSDTSSNAQYTFELMQGATSRCDTFLSIDTVMDWYSCTWDEVSGDLSDLRVRLGPATRPTGGGQPTNARVFAAYLEVNTGPNPPNVTLINPGNDDVVLTTPYDFEFKFVDDLYEEADCYLYSNFSGSWEETDSLLNVDNNTETSFSVSENDNYYSWNVMCENDFGRSAFATNNKSVYMNAQPPNFSNPSINESNIRQNRSVRFNVSITDFFGIDQAKVTLRYPDNSEQEFVLNNEGDEFYYVFTNTLNAGTYTLTSVWANDTLGKSGTYNPGLSFVVEAIPPDSFNLVSPENNMENKSLNPVLVWEQTSTPDFKNYTLQISENEDFNFINFVYYTETIDNTSVEVNLLDNKKYYWRVIAFDVFNNQRISSQSRKYITDNTPPNITLNTPSNESFSTQVLNTFAFTPSDQNTLVSCFLYTNSSGSWEVVNQTNSISNNNLNYLSATGVEGFNSWNVQCYDKAGNDAFASENNTLIIDLTGPIVELISPENEAVLEDSNIMDFRINASDALANIKSCSLIINDEVQQTKEDVVNNEFYDFEQFLVNGIYSWKVSCKDANDWETVSETSSFTLESSDNDPPVITLNFPSPNFYSSIENITFNYTVQDATGIENCSLRINDAVVDVSTNVENFVSNYFVVNDLTENKYNWSVECYDNSSNYNFGKSSSRDFFIDLTDPVVILESPSNDSFLNFSNINFNYTPSDTNLDSCSLFINSSGSFEEVLMSIAPDNAEENSFNFDLPSGVFSWNVFCQDLSGRDSFAENNFSLSIDTMAPKYDDISINPVSPFIYEENKTYDFNISWSDNFEISSVFLEHNFSGLVEQILLEENGDVYNFSIQNLNTGVYYYKWVANDSLNNVNETDTFFYEVIKSNSSIKILLNSSENNLTINEKNYVNITGVIDLPSSGNIKLYKDFELINEGINNLTNITFFENPGYYNMTLIYEGDQNFDANKKSLFITVLDITPPNVTLIRPFNDSMVSTGNINLRYNVSDFSSINNCSLYINDEYNQTSYSVLKDSDQIFSINVGEDVYSWQVICFDSYNNEGFSDTRVFEAVALKELVVNVSSNKQLFEEGETILATTKVTDAFDNPAVLDVQTSMILGNTTTPWWDFDWKKRKKIIINETTGNIITEGVARANLTFDENINNCEEIRIIHHGSEMSGSKYYVFSGNNNEWCDVAFEVFLDANALNYDNYYVYYNNSEGLATEFLSMNESKLFNAKTAQADEGSPTGVANIIGKNDDYAVISQATGGGTHSAHGRSFISQIPGENILKVEGRYTYRVAEATRLNWAVRFSVNGGETYVDSFTGTSVTPKTTSAWDDITNAYHELSWTNVNNTRLQGRLVKGGGGTPATLHLFWVELNVSYNKSINTVETNTGVEESLFAYKENTTNLDGFISTNFLTQLNDVGNYSIVSLASEEGFENAHNHTFVEVVLDTTLPNVTLASPSNESRISKGFVNFSYEVFDTNIVNCTLYLGVGELVKNESSVVSNGVNFFENIYLDYNNYLWNVECVDKRFNKGSNSENFSFTVFVPDPEINVELLDNRTLKVVWEEDPEITYYNIYKTFDYLDFPEEPTITSLTSNNFSEDLSAEDKKFYKITSVIGDKESRGEFVGIYTKNLEEGFNMISLPFLLDDYELKTSSNNGFKFNLNKDCLLSVWGFDPVSKTFMRTDWVNNEFVPSTGSEDFTELLSNQGYFLETNTGCDIKIAGRVLFNETSSILEESTNLVSWLSAEEKSLPTDYAPSLIITEPENSITAINRFNSSTQSFELTIFYFVSGTPWGWWPSDNNPSFTSLNPGEAYYFDLNSKANWSHNP